MNKRLYILMLLLTIAGSVMAQKSDRSYMRKGNRYYRDSTYVKAETEYRKALEKNPKSTDAMYNLGNALLFQQKGKEAMEQYETVSKIEKNKNKLAQTYHNAGVILQSSKQYQQSIEAYKEALRNNPHDDETRYNLALAQKMLKDQQQQQQNQQQKPDQKDNKQDQNKDQQNEQQQQQQQNQNKDEMSKENAEQLLNAVMQDEKDVQDKVKKSIQIQGKKLDKDW